MYLHLRRKAFHKKYLQKYAASLGSAIILCFFTSEFTEIWNIAIGLIPFSKIYVFFVILVFPVLITLFFLRKNFYLTYGEAFLSCSITFLFTYFILAFILFIMKYISTAFTEPHTAAYLLIFLILGSVANLLSVFFHDIKISGFEVFFSKDELLKRGVARTFRIRPEYFEGFVYRPEVEKIKENKNFIISGVPGSGKTTFMLKAVEKYEFDFVVCVSQLMETNVEYLKEFVNLRDNVLILWDDVQENIERFHLTIGGITNERIRILASIRTVAKEKLKKEVMKDFEEVHLKFTKEQIYNLARNICEIWNIEFEKGTLKKLVEKVYSCDPTPFYILSGLIKYKGKVLTIKDVEALSKSSLGIWEDYYNTLTENQKYFIKSLRFLRIIGSPLFSDSAEFIHEIIFKKYKSEDDLKFLLNGDWFYWVDGRDIFSAHDIPLESSGLIIENYKEEIIDSLRKISKVKLSKDSTFYFLFGIGELFIVRRFFDRALIIWNKALELAKKFEDKYTLATTHYNKGNALGELKRREEAIKEYNAAIKIAEEIKRFDILAWAHNNKGAVFRNLGDNEKALKLFIKGRVYALQSRDIKAIEATWSNLCFTLKNLDRNQEYEKCNSDLNKFLEKLRSSKKH